MRENTIILNIVVKRCYLRVFSLRYYKTCPVHPSGLCGSADGNPGNDVVGGLSNYLVGGLMPNAWIMTWR